MRRGLLIAILAAAGLGAVGCGGDGDSSDATAGGSVASSVTTSDDLTKAELLVRGDEICAEADKAQEAGLKAFLKDQPNSQSSPAGRARLVREAGLPPIRAELEELAALGAPPEEEEEVEAILRAIERGIEGSEERPARLLRNAGSLFSDGGRLAARYGFSICSNPF